MNQPYRLPHERLANGLGRSKRSVSFRGLPISIEIEKGGERSGIDETGRIWSHVYKFPYGEVSKSKALSDGDPVDVYIGDYPDSDMVYVVHQLDLHGVFDEDKCLLGFASAGEAVSCYKSHGPSWGFGSMDTMTWDQFLHGYLASNRRLNSKEVEVTCKRCKDKFMVGDWDTTRLRKKMCFPCLTWENRFSERDAQERRTGGWSNPV